MSSAAGEAGKTISRRLGEVGTGVAGVLGIGGIADYAEGNGLDKAEDAAGEFLEPIFGGVPWEMSASEIVDAVVPNFLPDAIPGAAATLTDVATSLL